MTILDNKEERLISLLNRLNHKRSYSISELSMHLNCSVSTVLNDIKFFSNNWSKLINIEINKNNIVTMESTSLGNTNKIISDIIFNSLEIQFIRCLFFNPKQNIYFYSETLYTSPPTLYRVIKKLTPELKKFGIKITNENKTYNILSVDETDLFLFMAKGLEEFYGLELPMDSSKNEFDTFSSKFPFKLPEEQFFMFLIYGIIKRNNKIGSSQKMIDFSIFREKYNQITPKIELAPRITIFLKHIQETFDFSIDADFKLKCILTYCVKRNHLYDSHHAIFINRYRSFVENFAKLNPNTFDIIEIPLKKLLQDLEIDVDSFFDYVVYLFFTNCQLSVKKTTHKTIYIYSDLGLLHAHFLKDSLFRVITDDQFCINVVEREFFDINTIKKNELIISTTFIADDLPIIYVDDYLTDMNYIDIKKELRLIN